MGKIAIDIALLLPEEIEDLCIDINKKNEKIRPLGKNDYRPHITLAMGIIDEREVKSIQDYLQNFNASPLDLTVNKIKYTKKSEGNESLLEVINTPELQALHRTILDSIKQYLQKGASVEMLYKGDETGMTEGTKLWLDTFVDKITFENYWPHITLNCYNAETDLPIKFKVDTIVLCHVGDGVTCRKILFETKLKN